MARVESETDINDTEAEVVRFLQTIREAVRGGFGSDLQEEIGAKDKKASRAW